MTSVTGVGIAAADPRRPWPAPSAVIPVRGVAPGPTVSTSAALAAASVSLVAAAVTAGTVLVRGWPLPGAAPPADAVVREVLAAAGAYVVRSPAGLTVTSRSTAGELVGLDADLVGTPELAPLVLALAATASTPSTVRLGASPTGPADRERAELVVTGLRALGGRLAWLDGAVEVYPAPLRAAPGVAWTTGGDGHVAFAGAVLGLVVPGVVLDDLRPAEALLPGFDHWWLRLLLADEHMLPGSDPHPGW